MMSCEYCEEVRPRRNLIDYSDLKLGIEDGELVIVYEGCTDREVECLPIDYCPMCGRKLEEDACLS